MSDAASGTTGTGGAGAGDVTWDIRPMAVDDVDEAIAVIEAANAARAGSGPAPAPDAASADDVEDIRLAHRRFVERDGPGAWVAVSDGRVVGVAESIRRGGFWGLSMLFVHPGFQGRGVGRQLLAAALRHAEGASQRMIQSSPDPRAMRRYFLAGLRMHPAAELGGTPDRTSIPAGLPGRHGSESDLDLVEAVERLVGRSRAEDVAFGLSGSRSRLEVVDGGPGRGWALWRPGRLVMLGATDEETATTLLWRSIAESEGGTLAYGLTAAQQWAFAVAHRAGLTVRVAGAVFVDGMTVPGPWIPSGWYF